MHSTSSKIICLMPAWLAACFVLIFTATAEGQPDRRADLSLDKYVLNPQNSPEMPARISLRPNELQNFAGTAEEHGNQEIWLMMVNPGLMLGIDERRYIRAAGAGNDGGFDYLREAGADFSGFRDSDGTGRSGFLNSISSKSGYGFLSSLVVPGLGQAANEQYWKTGLFLLLEATALYIVIDGNNRGRRLERDYIRDGNRNWSVAQYTRWVHEYYHNTPGAREFGAPDYSFDELLTPAGRAYVQQMGIDFPNPQFGNTTVEWEWINLPVLRDMERNTHYLHADGSRGSRFSHDVPDYGSQQYYELMSKYWQFGPGWQDWGHWTNNDFQAQVQALNARDNNAMSPMWRYHAILEERFNDAFRLASNMLGLMIVNHIVSAFDAYFTIKLRNHRLESSMELSPFGGHYTLRWSF